jgi:ribonuclease P protein component
MQPHSQRPSQRLPRRRILRRRRDFDAAFEKGKRFHNRYLTLLILPREAEDSGEVAFLTPKRLGDAVIRNRLRRRLREAYRLHFPAGLGHRLIWLAKSPAIALDSAALVRAMKELHGSIG